MRHRDKLQRMAFSEFDLIGRYLSTAGARRNDVILGVGDDCALLRVPPGRDLAVSMDTLVEGVHFASGCDPHSLGHKALAVNLSDLAAMGAKPAWATLSLTLPEIEESWIAALVKGFSSLADAHRVGLVGGDTTHGPLSITVQVHGFVEPGRAMCRDGARSGDLIGVSGTLGDAGLALTLGNRQDDLASAVADRLNRPVPRVAAGLSMVGVASAAIDISDGLIGDLGHICRRSRVGAQINVEQLPLSLAVRAHVKNRDDWSLPLTAGDDYELCVTVSPEKRGLAEDRMGKDGCGVTWIGVIEQRVGIRCFLSDGRQLKVTKPGYEHFR